MLKLRLEIKPLEIMSNDAIGAFGDARSKKICTHWLTTLQDMPT